MQQPSVLAASSMSRCSGSIARMKSICDSGSPCRKPLACFMRRLGTPLRRILKEDVASKVAIQSLHLCPKPNTCIVSGRKTQLTESKALDMSSLMKRDGRLALWRALITLWTYKKLSWMHLFFMKEFWHPDTHSFSLGASLLARTLIIILARLLMRLIVTPQVFSRSC
jgi:hypothetical protein